MTENEARQVIECIGEKLNDNSLVFYTKVEQKALDIAIQALEEIQQYRAIGTVEEFKDLKEKETEILLKDGQILYQQGLVDGYAKAIEEFKALKERNVAKKPLPKGTHKGIDNFYCPNCNHPLTNRHEQCELPYCDICGQKLDWQ